MSEDEQEFTSDVENSDVHSSAAESHSVDNTAKEEQSGETEPLQDRENKLTLEDQFESLQAEPESITVPLAEEEKCEESEDSLGKESESNSESYNEDQENMEDEGSIPVALEECVIDSECTELPENPYTEAQDPSPRNREDQDVTLEPGDRGEELLPTYKECSEEKMDEHINEDNQKRTNEALELKEAANSENLLGNDAETPLEEDKDSQEVEARNQLCIPTEEFHLGVATESTEDYHNVKTSCAHESEVNTARGEQGEDIFVDPPEEQVASLKINLTELEESLSVPERAEDNSQMITEELKENFEDDKNEMRESMAVQTPKGVNVPFISLLSNAPEPQKDHVPETENIEEEDTNLDAPESEMGKEAENILQTTEVKEIISEKEQVVELPTGESAIDDQSANSNPEHEPLQGSEDLDKALGSQLTEHEGTLK
ncbi:uncharacterized protein LOC106702783 [Latimeria chalumnae]|uniref:uncharacterized protein LOC106702783 n=1 Tax=Latimeria chalumnae TaxID=7897 RepID=UPI0006D8F599|nr:PREDICTED: uncharacterized protein LOC106702783 [Latimeria chalumnae]|eukprot:XP_014341491.1 PREDICTED: uncharacterized protein LOC106702783 [Latimeria chalumnae]